MQSLTRVERQMAQKKINKRINAEQIPCRPRKPGTIRTPKRVQQFEAEREGNYYISHIFSEAGFASA